MRQYRSPSVLIRLKMILIMFLMLLPKTAVPQDNTISLAVSPVLQDSGLMKFLLPRYSLKTGVFIDLSVLSNESVIPDAVDLVLTSDETAAPDQAAAPVMLGYDQTFFAISSHPEGADTNRAQTSQRFIDWLLTDIGRRTIEQFRQDGEQVFLAAIAPEIAKEIVVFDGDQNSGEDLAYKVCGRCHVIGQRNRMKGLESTPSFALMRTFDDWQRRYETFFTLNPHPSFSQITDVTPPFDPSLPPPISPIVLTLEQLDDIVAFVATIEPANLGSPLEHQ